MDNTTESLIEKILSDGEFRSRFLEDRETVLRAYEVPVKVRKAMMKLDVGSLLEAAVVRESSPLLNGGTETCLPRDRRDHKAPQDVTGARRGYQPDPPRR